MGRMSGVRANLRKLVVIITVVWPKSCFKNSLLSTPNCTCTVGISGGTVKESPEEKHELSTSLSHFNGELWIGEKCIKLTGSCFQRQFGKWPKNPWQASCLVGVPKLQTQADEHRLRFDRSSDSKARIHRQAWRQVCTQSSTDMHLRGLCYGVEDQTQIS